MVRCGRSIDKPKKIDKNLLESVLLSKLHFICLIITKVFFQMYGRRKEQSILR